jgi:hypothetical protein
MTEKSKRVVVISSAQTSGKSKSQKITRAILPALRFQPDTSLIELEDGSVRQIFEVEGTSLYDYIESREQWEQQFKALIDELKCDIQLIATSRPFAVGSSENYAKAVGKSDDPYLHWGSEYIYRWFWRMAECSYIPTLRFYFVLTMPSSTTVAAALKESFDSMANACLGILQKGGHQPRILDRDEVRSLLMQFVMPPANCEIELPDSFPEALTASTLIEPDIQELSNLCQIGDLHHIAGYFSQLPARTSVGWLVGIINQVVPYTFAIHIRPCDQNEVRKQIEAPRFDQKQHPELSNILNGQAKAVDVSISFATYGQTDGEAQSNFSALRNYFTKAGATVSDAHNRQIEILRSTFPLGISGPSQRVSSEVAANCWPATRIVPAQKIGLPLGYAWSSREPYFLDASASQSVLITGEDRDRTTLTTLIAARSLNVGTEVLYIGKSQSARFLTQICGKSLSELSSILGSLSNKQFSMVEYKKSKLADSELLAIEKTIKGWLDDGRQMLVIEDAAIFLKSEKGTALLKRTVNRCKRTSTPLYLAVAPKLLALMPDICQRFNTKFVLPLDPASKKLVQKTLPVSDKINMEGCDTTLCLAINGNNRSVIRLAWSPMETGILARSTAIASQTAENETAYRAKLLAIKDELMAKTPALSETDAWRQAVYYFGLQCEN